MSHAVDRVVGIFAVTRSPISTTLGLVGLACLCCSACAEPARKLPWRFRFGRRDLTFQVQQVVAEVLTPDCQGRSVFTTSVSNARGGESPPSLGSGRYAFRGRALTNTCLLVAEGCLEVSLPREDSIEVLLEELAVPRLDAGCTPLKDTPDIRRPAPESDQEIDGAELPESVPGPPDAGALPLDGEAGILLPPVAIADAGASPSADVGIAPDITVNIFDPTAPKCSHPDREVVACFDFEDTLSDSSSYGNDAIGPLVSFEPGLSGKALRVGGRRVAIADDASLNFSTFTVELWLRSDSLQNLMDKSDPRSVLLDKNGQYLVAYQADGLLRAHLHRGNNVFEPVLSSGDVDLVKGVWTYLAFAYDGNVLSFYKDGVRVDAKSVGVLLSRGVGAALHLGSGSPDVSLGFDGLLDAVRISNVPRGDAWVCESAGRAVVAGGCQ